MAFFQMYKRRRRRKKLTNGMGIAVLLFRVRKKEHLLPIVQITVLFCNQQLYRVVQTIVLVMESFGGRLGDGPRLFPVAPKVPFC